VGGRQAGMRRERENGKWKRESENEGGKETVYD
jgi:hypothetical protein